jgi:hypothetical protein
MEVMKMGWAENVARNGERLAYSVLVRAPRGKRSPGRYEY